MKTKTLLLFLLTLFLTSCDPSSVYNKTYRDFENNRWTSDNVKTFEFEIKDDSKPYDLFLKFGHVYDFQFETIPLRITVTNPNGTTEELNYNLRIKDLQGTQLADCVGDVCDLKTLLKEKTKLEKGHYKIEVSSAFKGPYLPNVLAVGVDVKLIE